MPPFTEYSKPPADVADHTRRLTADNDRLLERQRRIAQALTNRPERKQCIVCEKNLAGAGTFQHRHVAYFICQTCGHVQTVREAGPGYPYTEQDFSDIYRPLAPSCYSKRTERIYDPKLKWILRAAKEAGLGDPIGRRWLELGSGTGNFMQALRRAGAQQIAGIDAEATLTAEAARHLGESVVAPFQGTLAEALRQNAADIYVAWFVLEHCFDTGAFLDALREKPAGTIFVMSVPTFGLATLLESAFDKHYARNLDSVLHIQLFTDRSINYAMDRAGFDIKAEWIFGQDADDLLRAMVVNLAADSGSATLAPEIEKLMAAIPGLQNAIDRARLADSRHILAVRR